MLRKSHENRGKFSIWAHAYLEIDSALAADLPRIVDILAKYRDLRPDFADASLVALCERIGTGRIATMDSDFDVYRMLSNEPFENVFKPR